MVRFVFGGRFGFSVMAEGFEGGIGLFAITDEFVYKIELAAVAKDSGVDVELFATAEELDIEFGIFAVVEEIGGRCGLSINAEGLEGGAKFPAAPEEFVGGFEVSAIAEGYVSRDLLCVQIRALKTKCEIVGCGHEVVLSKMPTSTLIEWWSDHMSQCGYKLLTVIARVADGVESRISSSFTLLLQISAGWPSG